MEIKERNWELIWNQTISKLASSKNIDSEIFNNYISKGIFMGVIQNTIIIEVSSEISKTVFYQVKNEIDQQINENLNEKDQFFVDFLTTKELISFKTKLTTDYKEPKTLKTNLYQAKNFKNFIKGKSNAEAYSAAFSVVAGFDFTWNPLFLYGSSGLGKTHLLYAIKNEINLSHKEKTVCFLNSDDLGREIVEIIRQGHDAIETYKKKLKKYDVLLVDDIQFLAFRDKTNEIIFSILNFFIKWRKQIVLTSDCNPGELSGFENRLISRFNSGLCLKINSPEFDTAVNIINHKLKLKKINIHLEMRAIEFIAVNFRYDIRLIEGIINRIIFWSIINDKKEVIEKNDVVEILKPFKSGYNKKITLRKIIDVVSKQYRVGIDRMKSNDRTRVVVNARRVFVYLSRRILNEPYKKIGSYINKDHSTTIFAFKVIEKKMESDTFFREQINQIMTNLNG